MIINPIDMSFILKALGKNFMAKNGLFEKTRFINRIADTNEFLNHAGKIDDIAISEDNTTLTRAGYAISDYLYGVGHSKDLRTEVIRVLMTIRGGIKSGDLPPKIFGISQKAKQEEAKKEQKIKKIEEKEEFQELKKDSGLVSPFDTINKSANKLLLGLGLIAGTYALFTIGKVIPKK